MSPWPSHPPGPSSVPKWLLQHVLLITVLLSLASTKDLCDTKSDFGNLIHTIGVIDNELWAIAKDKNWTVYKLVPYKMHSNGTLDDSMIVSKGVSLESKWPQLAEAIKNASGKTDFNFTVDNSIIMYSIAFGSTVFAMQYRSPKPKVDFGYNFGTKRSIPSVSVKTIEGSYISTDEKDKVYTIDNSGTKIQSVNMTDQDGQWVVLVFDPTKYICNLGSTDQPEVQFTNSNDQCKLMDWTVLKGVLYHSQYYFFASGKVYIVSDQANTAPTKMLTVLYEDFLQCKQPTTMAPSTLTSVSNVTNALVTEAITNGNKTMTSTKDPNPDHSGHWCYDSGWSCHRCLLLLCQEEQRQSGSWLRVSTFRQAASVQSHLLCLCQQDEFQGHQSTIAQGLETCGTTGCLQEEMNILSI